MLSCGGENYFRCYRCCVAKRILNGVAIRVRDDTKALLDVLSDRTGQTMPELIDRMATWLNDQPDEVQMMVLGRFSKDSHLRLLQTILKVMVEQSATNAAVAPPQAISHQTHSFKRQAAHIEPKSPGTK